MYRVAGVAIGGGWQGLVAYINLGSYYVFGIPLGYLLGYVANFGVKVNKLLFSKFKSLFAFLGIFI